MSKLYKASEENRATVFNAIGYGKQEGKTRAELVEKTGLTDRIVRAAIHDLRVDGNIIVSIGASGYFFPSNMGEIAQWIAIEQSRVKHLQEAMIPAMDFVNWKLTELMHWQDEVEEEEE